MNKIKIIACVCSFSLFFCASAKAQSTSYFGDYIVKIRQTAQMAMDAQSLDSLQTYARKTMEAANAFQKAAQSVNDDSFVSQAVDIYTYAQRALMSSTLPEARDYLARVESYVGFSSEQTDDSSHNPEPYYSSDWEDVSYRNYYDHNYDVVYYNPQ